MEVPEKIYVKITHPISDKYTEIIAFEHGDGIEYIRKDAFIEKVCEWLKENFLFDEAGYCKTNIYSIESMIYNFKNTFGGKL